MEGFKFSLQKVLDIAISEEKESKSEYEKLSYELSDLERSLVAVESEIRSNNSMVGVIDISELYLKDSYKTALELKKKKILDAMKLKEKEIEEKLSIYIEKQLDRKSFDILRDKELKEHIIRVDMEEQVRNDEYALYSYVKNNKK